MYLNREAAPGNVATAKVDDQPVSVKTYHEHLGHIGEDETRRIAKVLKQTLTKGTLKPCEACAIGKAKRRNLGHAG